uniref:hypothetical protein n=1 Tax=Pedobacter sp. TaxID=1411316 RepID=UPI0015EE8322|nr:hypothetical protein [Pedobacter sp.]
MRLPKIVPYLYKNFTQINKIGDLQLLFINYIRLSYYTQNKYVMAKKVPVLVMVDPEVGAEIKPFASELAKAPKVSIGEETLDDTFSATYTYKDGNHDADATYD